MAVTGTTWDHGVQGGGELRRTQKAGSGLPEALVDLLGGAVRHAMQIRPNGSRTGLTMELGLWLWARSVVN